MSKKKGKNKKTRSKQYQAQDKKGRASSEYQTLKSGAKVAKKVDSFKNMNTIVS